jgi:Phosphotransferase enzyme family
VTVSLPGRRLSEPRMRVVLASLCVPVGLDARGAVLIRMTNNAVFHLPHDGVVVRVATTPALFHRVAKVIAVVRWLRATAVPSVELDERFEQPLRAAGTLATVWRYTRPADPPPGARDLARVMCRWHELPAPPMALPSWDPVGDARRRLSDAAGLDDADRAFLLERYEALEEDLTRLEPVLPTGVVHGDAHTGNLIRTAHGTVVVCDFDNTCVAPFEWDLVPAAYGALRFGTPERHREMVAAYGHDVTRSANWPVLRSVRELQMVTSVVPILTGSPRVAAQFHHRLRSIREGDETARWQPYT